MNRTMRITKTVKQTIDANDAYGWHIFKGGMNMGFETAPALSIIEIAKWQGWRLVGVTGNGLTFER